MLLPVPDHDSGHHSERSPSTAHRWRLCKAAVQAERGLPDSVGEEAIQGTVFHDVAADCMEVGLDPHPFIGMMVEAEPGEVRPFTQEMADKMLNGLDLMWAMADFPGAELFVEKRVNLERWIGPDESGTSDAFIIDPFNWRLVTFDWKWGGLPVLPEWNDQAILYTLGVWDTFASERFYDAHLDGKSPDAKDRNLDIYSMPDIEVIIIIEQPRAPGGGGVWHTTMSKVLEEGRLIRKDADATLLPDPPYNPGEKQCKFCRAAKFNTCEARKEMVADLIGLDFDEMATDLAVGVPSEVRDRSVFTPEQRSQLIRSEGMITDLIAQLKEDAMRDNEQGRETPGLKRVAGRRPPRKWRDPGMAELLLMCDFGDDAFTRKVKSPTQIEDTVGKAKYKERYQRQVEEGEGKPILVPLEHPGEPLMSIDEKFDELNDDQLI